MLKLEMLKSFGISESLISTCDSATAGDNYPSWLVPDSAVPELWGFFLLMVPDTKEDEEEGENDEPYEVLLARDENGDYDGLLFPAIAYSMVYGNELTEPRITRDQWLIDDRILRLYFDEQKTNATMGEIEK